MSAFQSLKTACKAPTVYKKFDQIAAGEYTVLEFKFVSTRIGKKLVVVTTDFMCFLPDRIAKSLSSDEVIAELNRTPCVMKYGGKDVTRHNRLILDFEPLLDQPDLQDVSWTQYLTLPTDEQMGAIMQNSD